MAIINAIIPKRTVTTLKVENGVKLKEIAIVWGISPYVYYEVCEGNRSHFEKNYFTALNYYYTLIIL